jgi:hypothetical protein
LSLGVPLRPCFFLFIYSVSMRPGRAFSAKPAFRFYDDFNIN